MDDLDNLDDFLELCDEPARNWPWIVALLLWWMI
jgi:hypothetical protein